MSSNDLVILDQILDQQQKNIGGSLNQSEFFEIYTAEQILKDFDLTYDEIKSGTIGAGGDGGIDSIYLFVNGEIVLEDTDITPFKKDITIDLVFIQSKRSSTFTEEAINKLYAVSKDLLDLSNPVENYSALYNSALLEKIGRFREVYKDLAGKFPKLRISYFYASRGLQVDHKVKRKSEDLARLISQLFSNGQIRFEFVGASELLQLARRTATTTYTLNLAESPISSGGAVGFICIVKLSEYFKFITDEHQNLRRNIFEANVRDYQGDVQVNAGIQETLRGDRREDFWWLNNGVTIVASNATQGGKVITIENPYVVNGLQTSTEVYKYFKEANTEGDERHIQVKIVVPDAIQSRDRIIKATNSQTHIPVGSLRATEKIHRDIEDFLRPYQIFYDRRKNYYKNDGKPIERIISIAQLSQAVMAILLARPDDARARPSSLLKNDEDYGQIFNVDYPLELYKNCAQLLKRVEAFTKSEKVGLVARDRNNLKFHIAMCAARRLRANGELTVADCALLDVDLLTDEILLTCTNEVKAIYEELGGGDQVAKGPEFRDRLLAQFS